MEYLGYLLSPDGLTMSNEKLQAIVDWLEPQKVKDIQSFLGFANFYRRFIYNYSDIVVPLTQLTRKDAPWNFSDECWKSFETLKKAFTTAPILTHWMPNVPLIVETDASDYAITGILSIVCPDSEIRPVAFYSRTLTPPELNYDTHDKELLAIHEAFRTWRHYLEGSSEPVDVVTDHKNLEYFVTTKLLSRHQARWSEFLHQFNMIIRFHPGKLGAKPDSLTRCWDVYPKEGDKDYAQVNPHNFRPVFTSKQLASSLRASTCNYQQDNWLELLPLAEFTYNNAPSATTGVSPFFANKGYHPNISIHPECDLSSALARDYAIDLNELHLFLREEMSLAQKRYQGPADAHRIPAPDFKVGEQVFVKAKYFCSTRPSKKLSEKNLGPFEIIARPGSHSITVRLPDSMHSIHPVFHVSQLEPATLNTIPNRIQPPPPPVEVNGEPEYEISEILDSKLDRRRRQCQLLYLVRWSGYEGTDKETSWLLATELGNVSELVSDYHSAYPDKPGPIQN
jgi:hypothetical protein